VTRFAKPLFRRFLADQRGISLIVAVMMLSVLTVAGGSVAVYTTNNLRAATADQSSAGAYQLAQAGLQEAMAKLQGADDPTVSTLFQAHTTVTYPALGGTAEYWGVQSTAHDIVTWTFTSKGTLTAGSKRIVVLQQNATVRPLVPGADLGSWSRFYADDDTKCVTIDTVNMPAPIATRGCLKVINGGSITGTSNNIEVGKTVTVTGPATSTGTKAPTTGVGTSWVNPNNVATSNNVYATYSIGSRGTSNTLTITNFTAGVPASAQILGVVVGVERKASVSSNLQMSVIKLVKAGVAVGTDQTSSTGEPYFGTSDAVDTWGSSTSLWGTTLTAADVNASTFGVQLSVYNGSSSSSVTASIDQVTVNVYYTNDTNGIGTSAAPIAKAIIGQTCNYNAQAAHTPCTSTDHVYATAITMQTPDDLEMPQVDWAYWYQNAAPGPKHNCDNASPGMGNLKFDSNTVMDASIVFDNDPSRDMTPLTTDYQCLAYNNGVLVGDLEWNHTTHVLKIGGTIFFDGNVRFDDDGQLIHYQGRGIIMAYGNIEFDELVCAGGTGTASTCANSMSSWDPSKNYLVLYGHKDSEYDQGGASCSNMPAGVTCAPNGLHPQSGFQGTLSADANCTIHEQFRLSGPVICKSIDLPYESDGWPTYFPFPSLTDLVDGQKYGSLAGATAWEIKAGPVSG
jgi:Tfp pilus assembly protein PilX